jgi:hypothetical protein
VWMLCTGEWAHQSSKRHTFGSYADHKANRKSEAERALPLRAVAQPLRSAVPHGRSLPRRDHQALRSTRAGTGGTQAEEQSFSSAVTEVLEPFPRTISHCSKVRRPACRRRHRLLCRRFRMWNAGRPDCLCLRGRLPLPRSQSCKAICLHPEDHDQGTRLG